MPRSSSTENFLEGTGGFPVEPPPVAFGYNPKLEFDDFEDAPGELDSVPYHEPSEADLQDQKQCDVEDEPLSTASAKRKRPLKLTASQRERKRAIDREAQRSIRIKTKNYIAHLENLVKVVEESDSAGPEGENNRTRELMNQLRHSQEEVRRLKEALVGVQRAVGTILEESPAADQDTHENRNSSTSISPPSTTQPAETVPSRSFSQPQTKAPTHMPLSSVPLPSQLEVPIIKDLPERPNPDIRQRRVDGEMFYFVEYQLNRVIANGPASFSNQPFDDDIVVRAVLEGWNSVEDHHDLDLGWQALREVDQGVWMDCGVVERLAIMRLMRCKLLHQVNSKSAGHSTPQPTFFSQEVMKHDAHADVVDHFVWPGFRNAVYSSPHKYVSNYFNDKFRHNLKFAWPYDISDAFTKDGLTGLYTCTPEFAGRQMDMRCWTMRKQFFTGTEELFNAIPVFEAALAKSLPPPPLGVRQSSFNMGGQRTLGMVEEQEVVDEQDMHQHGMMSSTGVQASSNTNWHGAHTMQHEYWQMSAGMQQSYNGLTSQAGPGYMT